MKPAESGRDLPSGLTSRLPSRPESAAQHTMERGATR